MALGEGDVLGGYRIVRLIGRGGVGAVYLAEDVRLGRKVALKVLAPETAEIPRLRERFVRESQLAASLDHPNILPIYEAGEADGQLFMAMRYVPGPDLSGVIERDGPLALDRTVGLIEQVASALDAAHAAGLVHRDVKPGNILVAAGSQPGTEHAYLADFGLTKHAEYSGALARSGQLMGSVGYVAPEQIENRPIDRRVDVYSLGCVLYECLAGAQPYPRDTDIAILYAHVQAPPPSLAEARPELPAAVDAVIAKALAKAPDERYPSAGELARALAAAAAPDAAARHLTRGFLFADLRGYTAFVEAHGDDAAASLLDAYRRLVRDVVRRYGGAEIKTEGDSFYVVFPSASDAVRCGLALVTAAAAASAQHPGQPIAVGVGVHAGETAETPEGYVGSAVNLAARLCAGAAAGEVLVSDTVRGLTRTGGEVTFAARGRRHLKGIAEPIAVYAATAASPTAAGAVPPTRSPITTRLAGFGDHPRRVALAGAGAVGVVAIVALLVGGVLGGGITPTPRPGITASGTTTRSSPSGTAPASIAASASSDPSFVYGSLPVLPTTGRILAGTYRPKFFAPGLELRVKLADDSWTELDTFGDEPDLLQLRRVDLPGDRVSLNLVKHVSMDGCFDKTASVANVTPQDLSERVSAIHGLTTVGSATRPGVPNARPGIAVVGPQLDVTVGAGNACYGSGTAKGVWIVPASEAVNLSPDPGGNWIFFEPGVAARVTAFGWYPTGSALAMIESSSTDQLDRFLPTAEALLDSLYAPTPAGFVPGLPSPSP